MEPLMPIINRIRDANGQKPLKALSADMDWRKDLGFDSFSLAELSAVVEAELGVDAFRDGVPANPGELWNAVCRERGDS